MSPRSYRESLLSLIIVVGMIGLTTKETKYTKRFKDHQNRPTPRIRSDTDAMELRSPTEVAAELELTTNSVRQSKSRSFRRLEEEPREPIACFEARQ
jgi:hypothetical protein